MGINDVKAIYEYIVANGMKDDESEIAFPAWITRINQAELPAIESDWGSSNHQAPHMRDVTRKLQGWFTNKLNNFPISKKISGGVLRRRSPSQGLLWDDFEDRPMQQHRLPSVRTREKSCPKLYPYHPEGVK